MNSILSKLDEMAKRREAATPGPWRSYDVFANKDYGEVWVGPEVDDSKPIQVSNNADAAFIAAARTEHEILEKALRIALACLHNGYVTEIEKIEALFSSADVPFEEKK